MFQVIGNRLAQVHFYKKEDAQSSAETMETLVHKTSAGERHSSGNNNTGSNVQYSSMSNTNAPTSTQVNPAPSIALPQPAPITKAAKPIRDSAQFVSENFSMTIFFHCRFQVDLVSAVLFPVAFIVFNIIYW